MSKLISKKKFNYLGGFLIIFLFIIYLLERKNPERIYLKQTKHDLFNMSVGIRNKVLTSFIIKNTYSVFETSKSKNSGLLHLVKLRGVYNWFVALILIDLWMYWWHRLNHQFTLLSKFHKFHHYDSSLNSTSAVRFHIIEIVISTFLRIAVFLTLGIERKHLNLYEKILSPVITFNHSNIRITNKTDFLIRKIIVSPEMHRTHHSTDSEEANSNYGSVLPYWDMIFKTYTKFPKKRVEFGFIRHE